jgi:hypothetical protein
MLTAPAVYGIQSVFSIWIGAVWLVDWLRLDTKLDTEFRSANLTSANCLTLTICYRAFMFCLQSQLAPLQLGQYPDEVFGTPVEKAAVLRFQMDLEEVGTDGLC